MRLRVLALDYDNTIAQHDRMHPKVAAALAEVRVRGVAVVLVTGRILRELHRVAGDLRLFDAVVAEGGAVIAFPDRGRSVAQAGPPPDALIAALSRAGVPIVAGQCIVEAAADDAPRVLNVIRQEGLPLAIVFNRDQLMVLPQSISKATGLREALAMLRLSAHNAVALGDAENDHALLEACEMGVAVPWASDSLKAVADEVLEGSYPDAIANYVRSISTEPRLPRSRPVRREAVVGTFADGRAATLAMRGRNVLVAGESGSGKSWVTGLLCENLIQERYSLCVIDPEGDYAPLQALPGVVVLGSRGTPLLDDVREVLRFPEASVVVDLSSTSPDERLEYVPALLKVVAELRRDVGLPHRIVVDEAQYFLDSPEVLELLDMELGSYTFVTYKASRLDPRVLTSSEVLLVTRESDPVEVSALRAVLGGGGTDQEWQAMLADLDVDEAALLEQDGGMPRRFRIAPRMTRHVRHARKYVDVPVSSRRAFVFTRNGAPTGRRARTLREIVEVISASSFDELNSHLRRGDFSRWLDTVYRDPVGAEQVRQLEERHRRGSGPLAAAEIARLIAERYQLEESESYGKLAAS